MNAKLCKAIRHVSRAATTGQSADVTKSHYRRLKRRLKEMRLSSTASPIVTYKKHFVTSPAAYLRHVDAAKASRFSDLRVMEAAKRGEA